MMRAKVIGPTHPQCGGACDTRSQCNLRNNLEELLFATAILLGAMLIGGCGGDAGVDPGVITGRVLTDFASGFATEVPQPLAGVNVLAQHEEDPEVIRTTKSDANGQYVLTDMPVAKYILGFQKEGFITIDTQQGATGTRTALGDQIRAYVEPGGVSEITDVVMKKLASTGTGTVIVTVEDASTGAPILDATVSLGSVASTVSDAQGRYTLQVPVLRAREDAAFGTPPLPLDLLVRAPGFNPRVGTQITPLPDVSVSAAVALDPEESQIEGMLRISQFDELFDKGAIEIDTLNTDFANRANVSSSGKFLFRVPSSSPSSNRTFDVQFSHPGLVTYVLRSLTVPRGGARNILQVVELQPKLVDLIGTVLTSTGGIPDSLGNVADTVTVRQTGQQAVIMGGQYVLPRVPTGLGRGDSSLDLDFRVFNAAVTVTDPILQRGVWETASVQVRPLTDTSFLVPLVRTSGSR